jgi:probable rRNA maturation factor
MVNQKDIDRLGKKILRLLKRSDATVDIFLLPHAEIKKLKARFIKKRTEPNVLAFPEPRTFPHPELKSSSKDRNGSGRRARPKKYLGEIYLNRDILRKSPERTAPLLLHGILHLLGYDHKKNADAVKMEALEKKIVRQLLRSDYFSLSG